MPEILLGGCRAEPIGSYLKALGVLRLVAEQLDPDVTGRWVGDTFAVDIDAGREELLDFFLNSYKPTPVVAPWNGRTITAFQQNKARNAVRDIETSSNGRLGALRATIAAVRSVYDRGHRLDLNLKDKKHKDRWVELCRSYLPDEALAWIDAVVVLSDEGAAFPLLTGGTGGVLGSGDLSLAYLETIFGLIEKPDKERTAQLIHCLFAEGQPRLRESLIGQFDPGAAGGANVGAGATNPWNLLLTVEGALAFTGGVARRLGFDQHGRAAMPFTVRTTLAGFGSAAEGEDTKGEVWTPLWRRLATAPEVRQLLAEGRANWAGNQALSALDFARAAGSLGVDRGIDQFVRHSIGPRLGQSNLAIPAGRVMVRERPSVPALAQLDRWFQAIRRMPNRPAAVSAGVRNVETAMFAAATEPGPVEYQRLLTAVARLERVVGRSSAAREKVRPIVGLGSATWLPLLDDGSVEFRLAASFASVRDDAQATPALRLCTEPVQQLGRSKLDWTEASAPVEGFGVRSITAVLAECVARRALEAHRATDREESKGPGITVGYSHAHWLSLADARAYFADRVDWNAFERLLAGLLCLDFKPGHPFKSDLGPTPRVAAFSVLAPFGMARTLIHPRLGEVRLKADPRWPEMLLRGRMAEVLDQALLRLRMARLRPVPLSPKVLAATVDPEHLATALILPLSNHGVMSLLDDICTAQFEDTLKGPQ